MEQISIEDKFFDFSKNEALFEKVFKEHFKALHVYAFTFVKEQDLAEDMVQQVFMRLWEKSSVLKIQTSITAYLYRAVYHECLNYLKHMKVRATHENYVKNAMPETGDDALKQMQLQELQKKINRALTELPEGCRTIFQMSRFESLKYREIAEKLNVSLKTVENQMGKALKVLREKLADYLPTILLFFISVLSKFYNY